MYTNFLGDLKSVLAHRGCSIPTDVCHLDGGNMWLSCWKIEAEVEVQGRHVDEWNEL
jgi:hypothetical protein